MSKASLGIAIIAKNAAKTIGACLDSIVPYAEQVVVAVDAMTTDDTVSVATRHGAKVHMGLNVSEPHTCEVHGTVMAQHFARARDVSFSYLRDDLDFHGWLDADDVVRGGEKLAEMLAKLPPEVAGLWLPYHYSQAGAGGPTSTLFDRERIVRANMPWQWQYRVHEILCPVGCSTESLNWLRTDEISIIHQGEGHDTAGSARRNIVLLEIDLEEDPNDMRAWFYLGNQYFALKEWESAAQAYDRATGSKNPYQLWQTLIYLSMTYEQLGDLENARMSAFKALDIQPMHAEPYLRLAQLYMLMGDVGRTEHWTKEGLRRPDPPFFVFRNPLDKSYNSHLTLATAYANNQQTTKARQELEKAAQVIPSKEVLDGIAYHRQLEEDSQLADAYVSVLNTATTNLLDRNTPIPIPDAIWRFGRVRDIIVPNIMAHRPDTQPRIIFWCGKTVEPWAPPSINGTGIGGSETAVIQIAKRFARDGWRVDVYNDCDKYEGVYEDVGYWDCKRLNAGESCDVFVSWRNPGGLSLPISRVVSLLWQHDLNSGPVGDAFRGWDRVLGVSQWHASYLSNLYALDNTGFVPNGIELDRFTDPVKKIPFRCVYASSPDRGLPNLLRMWPAIAAQEPTAELHLAYGWENIDKAITLWRNPQLAELKQTVLDLLKETPQVVWRGRLPQDELAKLYQESYVMLYPTSFLETFCIGAVEAMAGGCVPVVSAAGALPETVGDAGIVVTGNTYTFAWKQFWIQCAKAALYVPDVRLPLVGRGKVRASQLTWDRAYDEHWKPLLAGLLEGKKEAVEVSV